MEHASHSPPRCCTKDEEEEEEEDDDEYLNSTALLQPSMNVYGCDWTEHLSPDRFLGQQDSATGHPQHQTGQPTQQEGAGGEKHPAAQLRDGETRTPPANRIQTCQVGRRGGALSREEVVRLSADVLIRACSESVWVKKNDFSLQAFEPKTNHGGAGAAEHPQT